MEMVEKRKIFSMVGTWWPAFSQRLAEAQLSLLLHAGVLPAGAQQ